MTTMTMVSEYVYYRVLLMPSSSGLWRNQSINKGGGGSENNRGKDQRSAPGEAKPPISPPRATTMNASTQNPKRMMYETGRF